MAIEILHDIVGIDWILKAGEVYEFGPIRERNWIACGYAREHREKGVQVNINVGGNTEVEIED